MAFQITSSAIILFILVCLLVGGDKLLTYTTIKKIQDTKAISQPLTAEKNPVARFLFQKLGLGWGSVVFFFVSIPLFYLGVYAFKSLLLLLKSTNPVGIAWYIMFMIYGFVIMNNAYFMCKHSGVLP